MRGLERYGNGYMREREEKKMDEEMEKQLTFPPRFNSLQSLCSFAFAMSRQWVEVGEMDIMANPSS